MQPGVLVSKTFNSNNIYEMKIQFDDQQCYPYQIDSFIPKIIR